MKLGFRLLLFATPVALGSFAVSQGKSPSPSAADFYRVIRSNDLQGLRGLASPTSVGVADAEGNTPLLFASAIGSDESVEVLVAAGADCNQANKYGATALMWAAGDAAKVKTLLDHGAAVNAKTKGGRTALECAVYYDGPQDAARLLIDNGADVSALDAGNGTALDVAAGSNNLEGVRLLVEHGANVNNVNRGGLTALMAAAGNGYENGPLVKFLIEKGAKVNLKCAPVLGNVKNGPIRIGKLTALHLAASSSYEAVKALVDAGAAINPLDVRDYTPLVFAVGTDHADPRTVRLLLAHGAKRSQALEWARRYNNPAVLKEFGVTALPVTSHPVSSPNLWSVPSKVRACASKALVLNQTSSARFFKAGGCFSCHAQDATGTAVWAAKGSSVKANFALELAQTKLAKKDAAIVEQDLLVLQDPASGIDGMETAFQHIIRSNDKPDLLNDSLVTYVMANQRKEGDWPMAGNVRPPLEDGQFTATAKALQILHSYQVPGLAKKVNEELIRGTQWLATAQPQSTEDRTMQICGLVWAGAKPPANLVKQLVARQRSDGGWGQTDHLRSDAYATGQALRALHEAGIPSSDKTYRRGVAFLVRTQDKQGAWHVITRALSFQPYFESGFPYDQDQWISQEGTAMAALAMSYAAK